jgi:hypothetical protein
MNTKGHGGDCEEIISEIRTLLYEESLIFILSKEINKKV